jgi:GR25 family glycosyltransferase involved in LPS biosynthesis
MSLNNFDAVVYINLQHRKDRKNHILKELKRVNVDKNKINRISAHFIPFNGHLGCVLSHIDALNWAIKKNLNKVLILEDDCYFIDDIHFLNLSVKYFFKMVKKWNVYLFGGFYEKIEKSNYPYINRIKQSYRSHAYGIHKNYYSILKNNFLKTAKILERYNSHLDICNDALDRRWTFLQKKDLWYACNILLTGQISDYSDIGWIEKKSR